MWTHRCYASRGHAAVAGELARVRNLFGSDDASNACNDANADGVIGAGDGVQ